MGLGKGRHRLLYQRRPWSGATDKRKIHLTKKTAHQALERLGGVLQPERHPEELEEPEGGGDGGLRDVVGSHRDLVIAANQVQGGKNRRPESD